MSNYIIINPEAEIEGNCTVFPNVVIYEKSHSRCDNKPFGGMEALVVGNNVYIGIGAKIIEKLSVGDYVFVPNAVVVKDVLACSFVGIQAKIIKMYK